MTSVNLTPFGPTKAGTLPNGKSLAYSAQVAGSMIFTSKLKCLTKAVGMTALILVFAYKIPWDILLVKC